MWCCEQQQLPAHRHICPGVNGGGDTALLSLPANYTLNQINQSALGYSAEPTLAFDHLLLLTSSKECVHSALDLQGHLTLLAHALLQCSMHSACADTGESGKGGGEEAKPSVRV